MATTIRIDQTGDGIGWLYGRHEFWKTYVCDKFDDNVVVNGNRDYNAITEAKWWKDAINIITELDCYGLDERELFDYYHEYFTREQLKEVYEEYDKCRCSDDMDFIVKVANILHKEIEIETATIRGYTQSEWQTVAYIKGSIDVDRLETYYFGKLVDVTVEEDDGDCGDIITDDELWEMERKGLKEELRKRYDIDEDEELTVMKCDGYVSVANWKEVV